MTPEVLQALENLQRQINEMKSSPVFSLNLDPQSLSVLNNKLDLTPGVAHGDIFYVDANTEIKRLAPGTSGQFLKTLGSGTAPDWDDVPEPDSVQFGVHSFSVPNGTLVDTTTTHDFGFVPKMVFGALTPGGGGTVNYFAMWQNGQEQLSSIVSDGKGNSAVNFLGPDSSFYVNTLSVAGNILTLHYKNTGGSSATCYLWVIGV